MPKITLICEICKNKCEKWQYEIDKANNIACSRKCSSKIKSLKSITPIIGHKFNKLTVLEVDSFKNSNAYVKCLCDCGKTTITRVAYVKNSHTKSCGKCSGETPKDRFLNFVSESESGCWLWNGNTNHKGYGMFQYYGKWRSAHRVSYIIYNGDIHDDLHVCHSCDVRNCVNPDHLWLGSNRENRIDAKKKNRLPKGEKSTVSVLSDDKVRYIRKQSEKGVTKATIAKKLGCSASTVCAVLNGVTWKHIK